jgi:hypothetical protein
MRKMNTNRSSWNQRQKELRVLLDSDDHRAAVELFLQQHAAVHSAEMAGSRSWSFADEVWEGHTDESARRIPERAEHSLAWIIWHIARIEDVTMNVLAAGREQVLHRDNRLERLGITLRHTGNVMEREAVANVSAAIDLEQLRAYRMAVGRSTRELAGRLQPIDLKRKVDPGRLQRLSDEGAVVEEAAGLLEYWGGRTIAGLLLMPATRHNFVHLNEASRLRNLLEDSE